jgi:hypothetical protein
MKKPEKWFAPDPDAAVRVSVQTKAHGRLVIDWPRGIPVRLSQNIAKLAADHVKRTAVRGEAQARRDGRAAPHLYLRMYRRGCNRGAILELARKTLSGNEQRILINSLERSAKLVKLSEVDLAICLLDDAGKLTGCTQAEGARRVGFYLREHGFGSTYTVTLDIYRKHVKRLRDIGLKLQSM